MCTCSSASPSSPAAKHGRDGGMRNALLCLLLAFLPGAALAQQSADTFADREDGAKVHVSGFVCPQRIGLFERDAAGEYDLEKNEDFCSYASLDGIYGTITIQPLSNGYDPKSAFADDFRGQDATGGMRIGEKPVRLNGSARSIHTRTYRTARAGALQAPNLL